MSPEVIQEPDKFSEIMTTLWQNGWSKRHLQVNASTFRKVCQRLVNAPWNLFQRVLDNCLRQIQPGFHHSWASASRKLLLAWAFRHPWSQPVQKMPAYVALFRYLTGSGIVIFFSFRYWTEGLVHDTQVFHDGHVIYVQVVHNVHVVLSCSSSCFMSMPMSLDTDAAACMDMEHGTRTMDHGPWTMDHGPWTMDHGPWNKEQGTWNMEHGH